MEKQELVTITSVYPSLKWNKHFIYNTVPTNKTENIKKKDNVYSNLNAQKYFVLSVLS